MDYQGVHALKSIVLSLVTWVLVVSKNMLLAHTLSVSEIGGNDSGHRKFTSLRVTTGEVKKGRQREP